MEEIFNLETYKNAIANGGRTKKRTETSKELIRKANLNSKNAKSELVTNIVTK